MLPDVPLHDPGPLHDPFIRDAFLLCGEPRDPVSCIEEKRTVKSKWPCDPISCETVFFNVRRKRHKKVAGQKCKANACCESINLLARNDANYPLCESHKRAKVAHCDDGVDVSFCFYCNKVHSMDKFTHKTNICDRNYLRRRTMNDKKRNDKISLK